MPIWSFFFFLLRPRQLKILGPSMWIALNNFTSHVTLKTKPNKKLCKFVQVLCTPPPLPLLKFNNINGSSRSNLGPGPLGLDFFAYGIYCYLGFSLRLRVYLYISCCEVSDLKYTFVKKVTRSCYCKIRLSNERTLIWMNIILAELWEEGFALQLAWL